MNSDSESDVSIFSETNSEIDELINAMEQQIDNQNTEIKELKKQIENLKSLLISQLPEYLNAVLKYIKDNFLNKIYRNDFEI